MKKRFKWLLKAFSGVRGGNGSPGGVIVKTRAGLASLAVIYLPGRAPLIVIAPGIRRVKADAAGAQSGECWVAILQKEVLCSD